MGYKFNPFTGNLDEVGAGGTGSPGGSTSQVQFNDGGAFGGDVDLTWNKTTNVLSVGGDVNLTDGGTFTTTLQTVTPTANRTVSIPDATGTLALVAGSSGQLVYNNAGAYGGTPALTIDGSGNITQSSGVRYAPLGTAAAPSLAFTGDPNTGLYSPGADQLAISTGGVQRLTIGSDGTLIGTSATNLIARFTGPANGYTETTDGTGIARTQLISSVPHIGAASNHPLVLTTNNTERLRITSAGQLLVGTSSNISTLVNGGLQVAGTGAESFATLTRYNATASDSAGIVFSRSKSGTLGTNTIVAANDALGVIAFAGANGSSFTNAAQISCFVDDTPGANSMPGRIVLSTTAAGASTPTERLRIGNAGLSTFTSADTIVGYFNNAVNTSGYNGIMTTVQSNGNNTSTYHFRGNTTSVGNWYLYGNGTSSYSSDQRLKKNIETTRDGYLADICQLRVVKYNWNSHDEGAPKELGLIAQEVEQVFPGLVQEDLAPVSDEDPTLYKQLKGSVLPVIILKALQEAAEKIEALEAKVAALESA